MRALLLTHRWGGGLVGLFLALIGLSGAILLHRHAWIDMAFEAATAPRPIEQVVAALAADPDLPPRFVILPRDGFAFYEVRTADGAGAYVDAAGVEVARWADRRERPEHWLFDLHATLLAGELGTLVAGLFALGGLVFVVTGAVLWWQTRRTFELRFWPRRLTRPAIIRHHRDIGLVLAPVLVLSLLTGAAMAIKPVGAILVMPWNSPAELQAAIRPPVAPDATADGPIRWNEILRMAHERYPQADVRILGLPAAPNQPLFVRLRQPGEWTANGRTMLWFHPQTGVLLQADDPRTLIPGMRIYLSFYPLHAGEAGGVVHRWLMTASGLALALLGSLAVWTFWFPRSGMKPLAAPLASADRPTVP
jgi:uncharacterized iron-regulated membrane protein